MEKSNFNKIYIRRTPILTHVHGSHLLKATNFPSSGFTESKCRARAKIDKALNILFVLGEQQHTCPFDEHEVQLLKAKARMKEQALERPDRLKEIYDRNIRLLSDEAKSRLPYEKFRQTLSLSRRKRYPAQVKDIDAIVDLLTNPAYPEYSGYYRGRIDVTYRSKFCILFF